MKTIKQKRGLHRERKRIINTEVDSHLIKSFTIISRQLFLFHSSTFRLSLVSRFHLFIHHRVWAIKSSIKPATSTRQAVEQHTRSCRLIKIVKFYSYVCFSFRCVVLQLNKNTTAARLIADAFVPASKNISNLLRKVILCRSAFPHDLKLICILLFLSLNRTKIQ